MNNYQMKRQYDLDWLRVLATLAVFLYHSSMFFNPFSWHVKNNITDSTPILGFSLFLDSWIMPIFFAVSGISVYYALKKRHWKHYLNERLLRLGLPLLLGVFLLSPPQVYIERITHHQFKGSFIKFFPHYFDGFYLNIGGTGNFAFVGLHLWYLLVLLIFSFMTLPFFIRREKASKQQPTSFTYLQSLVALFLLILVSVLIHTVSIGGWDLSFYLIVFLFGYYFFTRDDFRPFIRKTVVLHLVIAMLTSILYIGWFIHGLPKDDSFNSLIFTVTRIVNCWTWLLFFFAIGDRYLGKSNEILRYSREASMPFYVLHQPIIVFFGFWLRNLDLSIFIKVMILVPSSFVVIMFFYHFVIKKVSILRILFGMKGRDRFKLKNQTIMTEG